MTTPTDKPQRGGSRPNSGRKELPTTVRRVSLNTRVLPSTLEWLRGRAADAGISVGALLDRLAK